MLMKEKAVIGAEDSTTSFMQKNGLIKEQDIIHGINDRYLEAYLCCTASRKNDLVH